MTLYAEIGTSAFQKAHEALKKLAVSRTIVYTYRPYSLRAAGSSRKAHLSGYGVELAIKSTEYKAQVSFSRYLMLEHPSVN